jgi:hypothetical protein
MYLKISVILIVALNYFEFLTSVSILFITQIILVFWGRGGVQLGPLGIAATSRPIVPGPGDYDDVEIGGMMIGREIPKYSEKTCPGVALSTTNHTCCPDANPGRGGGELETNRLSCGTALITKINLNGRTPIFKTANTKARH